MTKLFLATENGLIVVNKDSAQWEELLSNPVTAVAVQGQTILAGSRQGLYLSLDEGQSWQRVGEDAGINHIRWLAFDPHQSDVALAGSEPAAIHISLNGGKRWEERPEVADLRDRFSWFLPYSPEAGCIRGFATSEKRLYAAVEVGGLLSSVNGGASWRLVEGSDGVPKFGSPQRGYIHPDVHSIELHGSSPERLYAPTGGGFYTSLDAGETWQERHPPCYCRAVWVDPADPEHLVLGPARSVSSYGRIVESIDGGRSWRDHEQGLDTPWPGIMVERFTQVEDSLYAVLSDGQLMVATIGRWYWRQILSDAGRVRALAADSK